VTAPGMDRPESRVEVVVKLRGSSYTITGPICNRVDAEADLENIREAQRQWGAAAAPVPVENVSWLVVDGRTIEAAHIRSADLRGVVG
jgi:hypothetical protein